MWILLCRLSTESNLTLYENALLLTFDDGYIDNYTYVFPLLMEKKLQGTFFPPAKILVENCVLDVNKIHYLLANIEEEILFDDVLHQLDYYRSTKCPYSTNTELIKQYAVASRFDTAKTVFIKMMLQTVIPSNIRKIIIDNLFTKYSEVSEETLANELYVSASQLKVMKSCGMHIGIHGYEHNWLGNLDKLSMQKDIDMALDVMKDYIDINNWVMNYPYGSWNRETVEYVSSRGAVIGLTTEVGIVDYKNASPFELVRLDCNDFPPKSSKYKKNRIDRKI